MRSVWIVCLILSLAISDIADFDGQPGLIVFSNWDSSTSAVKSGGSWLIFLADRLCLWISEQQDVRRYTRAQMSWTILQHMHAGTVDVAMARGD